MPKIVAYLFVLVFFLLFHPLIFADSQVVINEFLVEPENEQQVELYNNGSDSVDISGWFIDDDGGTQKYTIPSGTILQAGQFKSFKSGLFNLNRASPDTVRLIKGDSVIDSKSYSQSLGAGKSLGRQPDGSNNWLVFDTPTWDQSNNGANGQALPTPTPTPTPSPTPSSSTSQSTSNAKSPTPTPKTTSTATIKSPSPTLAKQSPLVLSASDESSLLLASSSSENTSPSPSSEATGSALSKTKVAGLLAGSGAILIGLSIGFYLWYKRILRSSPPETDAGLKRILGKPQKGQSEDQA